MTVPLGNTPSAQSDTPEELKKDGLNWMGNATARGEQPVIVFYRTVEFGAPFAPEPLEPDRLVDPVTVDLYFPNGPLAGRVYRRVGFINVGLTRPIRATAIGSINVGQLGVGKAKRGGDYPQLNALDHDALDWASKIHQAAGGDVFAYYSGEPSAPVHQVAAPASTAPPVDRFAGQAPPPPAQAPAGFPGGAGVPSGTPAGMSGAPAPAAMTPPAAAPAGFGPPPGMPGAGQPQPTTAPPPAGVPNLGAPPAWAQQGQG